MCLQYEVRDRDWCVYILVPETRKFHRKRGSYFFCLVPRVAVWYRLSGTPFCSFTSVPMTSQRKAQRFPRRQRVPVTLKRTLLACFFLKCISQRGTRKIIKSQCWIQTEKSQSRVIRCHIPVSATASTGICDIVSPSTEICQSGSNTGTWFY